MTLSEILSGQDMRCTGIWQGAIYIITCTENNKCYVGQTTLHPPEVRWKSHIRELESGKHKNKYIQEDFNKYGKEKFCFTVVEYIHKEYLGEYERKWIHSFSEDNCYNIQSLRSMKRNDN